MFTCTCSYPDHEQNVGKIAKEMGFDHVSLSSLVMPMVRIVPRGFTGKLDIPNHDCFVSSMYIICTLQHVLMLILPHVLRGM